jgi:hypothetical protein
VEASWMNKETKGVPREYSPPACAGRFRKKRRSVGSSDHRGLMSPAGVIEDEPFGRKEAFGRPSGGANHERH